jgi:hypothetical protein
VAAHLSLIENNRSWHRPAPEPEWRTPNEQLFSPNLNRRAFLPGGASALSQFALRPTPADAANIVDSLRGAAVGSDIMTHKIRGTTSVPEGSGGNIGDLTGRSKRLLVDAGITASRPRINECLAAWRSASQASHQHALAL